MWTPPRVKWCICWYEWDRQLFQPKYRKMILCSGGKEWLQCTMEGKTHTWFTLKVILCFWSQDSVNRLEIKTKTKPSLIKEQLCAYMSVMCMCLYCMWLTYWAIAVYFIHICKLCFNVLFPLFLNIFFLFLFLLVVLVLMYFPFLFSP